MVKEKKKRDLTAGVTSKELAKWIKQDKSKSVATKYIREVYLEPLYNGGYLDKEDNPDDRRETLYSPISEKQGKLFGEKKIPIKDTALYPSEENLIEWIEGDTGDAGIVEPSDNSIALSTRELVKKYYGDPSDCFEPPGTL